MAGRRKSRQTFARRPAEGSRAVPRRRGMRHQNPQGRTTFAARPARSRRRRTVAVPVDSVRGQPETLRHPV